jgi:hypothetical protein
MLSIFNATDIFAARLSEPSVYYNPYYGLACANEYEAKWILLADFDGKWQIPLVVRNTEYGRFDAISPYGYNGIFIDASLSSVQIQLFWQESLTLMKDYGLISLFLRFSPFDLPSVRLAQSLSGIDISEFSRTILVPTSDINQTWIQMKGAARTAIRKTWKNGLTCEITEADDSLLDESSTFRVLYSATMDRLVSKADYYFSNNYYRTLLEGLSGRVLVATVRNSNGVPLASALFLRDENMLHYHLSGSERPSDGAMNLLLWEIFDWSATHGIKFVHLGGGTSPGDSLFRFKSSFGGNDEPYNIGKVVVDRTEYSNHLSRAISERGRSNTSMGTGFPEYRFV